MKKICLCLLLTILLGLFGFSAGVRAETAEVSSDEGAEWTVLFYFCGADLESKYGYATRNILEIKNCLPYLNLNDTSIADEMYGKVNVLLETGGSSEWEAAKQGFPFKTDCLQRWRVEKPLYDASGDDEDTSFSLAEELPLQSMADPETLTDFIRWGVQTAPAKKYALVLWGHGGGSKSGVLIDELFDGDILYLDELGGALAAGDTHFEAVIFDACMMANLETACAIDDHASWMIASEETVAGGGTAVDGWLQELIYNPYCGGEILGRCICDMTQIKYANEEEEQAQELLTWSVIDLSMIKRVESGFDSFFQEVGLVVRDHPEKLRVYTSAFSSSEKYGAAQDSMIDLGAIFYDQLLVMETDIDTRNEMLDALKDTVRYAVRGDGRSAARGLSFCFAACFDREQLESYSRNCSSPHYLAFLDAISDWTAPEWVYDTAERLPKMEAMDEYTVKIEKCFSDKGVPGFNFTDDSYSISDAYYRLYWLNEKTGNKVCLGAFPCRYGEDTEGELVNCALEPWLWPAVDGTFVNMQYMGGNFVNSLFNVPLQFGEDTYFLRFSFDDTESEYTVYGLWAGYDSDSSVFSRNVVQLSRYAGREYRMLYPIDGSGKTYFEYSDPQTMYRSVEMKDKKLPAGTYWIEYEIDDCFGRPMTLDRIEMFMDGDDITFPEGFEWEGIVEMHLDKGY